MVWDGLGAATTAAITAVITVVITAVMPAAAPGGGNSLVGKSFSRTQ